MPPSGVNGEATSENCTKLGGGNEVFSTGFAGALRVVGGGVTPEPAPHALKTAPISKTTKRREY
jgi:hypothetical protein